jgi:ribosomal protein L40E
MTCPRCGAHNTADARWCTQCYAVFDSTPHAVAERAGVAGPTESAIGEEPTDPDGASDLPPTEPENASDLPRRYVRERDGSVEWRCERCEAWSPLTAETCEACGATRPGMEPHGSPRHAEPAPRVGAVAAAAVVPGAGHVLLHRTAAGLARMLVFGLWVTAGMRWLVGGSPAARVPGMVLVLGSLLLWMATLVDTVGLTSPQEREPLGSRGLLWLVVGVTILLALAVTGVTVGAVRP